MVLLVVIVEDGANAHVARRVHEVQCLIDVLDGHAIGDELLQPKLSPQVFFHELRYLGSSLDATESSSHPHATSNELEGRRLDERTGRSDANDHRLAPALVAGLNRRSHQIRTSNAFESAVEVHTLSNGDNHEAKKVRISTEVTKMPLLSMNSSTP